MNEIQVSDTIQLTRIHACNWYGFSDSFDLSGQTVITGILGCGKTALIDLVQTVLLGTPDHENRYNLSVGDIGNTAKQIKRDLRGYALQDLNVTKGNQPVYAREGGRSYIGLEWTWPSGARRETWGIRVEYNSVGADAEIDYWHVPCRLEFSDFLGSEDGVEGIPLGAAAWLEKIKERKGTRYPDKPQYLTHIASSHHLNFDIKVFKPLLLQTLRFSFGPDFDAFCREHILPENRIDIEDTRQSYDKYRNFLERIQLLEEQKGELEKISKHYLEYKKLDEEISAFGWFKQALNLEEHLAAFKTAQGELDELQTVSAAWFARQKELSEARRLAREKCDEINRELSQKANAQEFEHYKKRQYELPGEIQDLVSSIGSPADVLRDYFDRIHALAAEAAQTARRFQWQNTLLDAQCPQELPVNLDAETIRMLSTKMESAAEKQVAAWKIIASAAKADEDTLNEQIATLRRDIVGIREHGTTEALPLREALVARFGKNNVTQLGDLCEVTDATWKDALEINFPHKLASLVADKRIAEAFAVFNTLTETNSRERLLCRADLLALSGNVEPGSLAEKIRSDDVAVNRLIAHLFGSIRCCNSIEEAEHYKRAILPSGAIKEPTGRRRQRATPSEYAIGRNVRETTIRAKEAEIDKLNIPAANAATRASAAVRLREGFMAVKEALLRLRADKVSQLLQLEQLRGEQSRITNQLNQLKNRDILEELRQQAQKKSNEADGYKADLDEHMTKQPATKASKEMAVQKAKDALEKVQKDTLKWKSENSEALVNASKHQQLEDEARAKSTSTRTPSATCEHLAMQRKEARATARGDCIRMRQLLRDHKRIYDFRDLDIEDLGSNAFWDKKFSYIVDTGIRDFTQKAHAAEIEWEDMFQKNVLGQLMGQLSAIDEIFRGLQRMIVGRTIGGARYAFSHHQADRSDYNQLRDLVTNLDLHNGFLVGTDPTKAAQVRELRRAAMKLFEKTTTGDARDTARQRELLDPRCYFTYNMHVTDAGRSESISINHRGRKGSGGETYNPCLIALMTAYMRAFRRHERHSRRPSISLLLMDEAFKVNDSAAVSDCVKIIAELGFQGVISCTNNVGGQIIEYFQWAMIVQKIVVQAADTDDKEHDEIINTVFAAPQNDPAILRLIDDIEEAADESS